MTSNAKAQLTPNDPANEGRELSLGVKGMTCTNCAGHIEKALGRLAGVLNARVNFTMERADVRFDPDRVDPVAIVKAILDMNYEVPLVSVVLRINGMTCGNCAHTIEKALRRVPGVLTAKINLATEQALLEVAQGQLDVMALRKAVTAAGYDATFIDDPENQASEHESIEARRRLRWQTGSLIAAILLSFPLVAQMLGDFVGLGFHLSPMVQMVLASFVQFGIGWRFYRAAWVALRHGNGTMDQLVALGTSAAYGLSVTRVLWPETEGAEALYFEASAIILTLVLLGKWLESRAKQGTSAAIRALMKLRPSVARLLRNGEEVEVPINAVVVGDVVLLRPGERVPVDGDILSGQSEIDESLITGESQPVEKGEGAFVTAGSVNGSGLLHITTTRIGAETTLSRIIALVQGAQASRAPVQKLVDRVSAVFVPMVLAAAVFTFMAQWLFTGAPGLAVIAAVSVLVIACPCALGLATPTAIVAGMGAAARGGILIKDVDALERMRKVTVIALDKTGTLTEGHPAVAAIAPVAGGDEDALLLLAASAQQGSEHPLARATLDAVGDKPLKPLASFKSLTGRGLEAVVDGQLLRIGNRKLMADSGVAIASLDSKAQELETQGATVMWIAYGEGRLLGFIAASDPIKATAAEAIARLKKLGLTVIMMTGDNQRTADAVASKLGIDRVMAEILPEKKIAEVKRLRREGEVVAMVGDGINDAPALAAADVGIAMGTGTDVAIEAAGVTLMRGEPLLLPETIRVSRATVAKIWQNLFWAFIYNVIGIPLAASGMLSPILAGGAMAFSSVSVVSNSLLLTRWHPLKKRI
ncbi:copper-translocating P-type ATPase [Rhodospirillaceae bacterium AH-315-P19]|nr:copper-translocating P-type ATPase [Rhodospirillaceae bacterium AH-315-P19]